MDTEPCWVCGEPIFWAGREEHGGRYLHVDLPDDLHDPIGDRKGAELEIPGYVKNSFRARETLGP